MEQLQGVYNTLHRIVAENGMFLALLGGVSLVLFAGTLLVIPLLVVSIPRDYFLPPRAEAFGFGKRHPAIRMALLIVKNIAGALCLAAGFVMLFIPGQGLLTMFIGVLLLNFPGKRRMELRLVQHPQIRHGIDWVRRRAGKEALRLPEENEPEPDQDL